MTTAASTLPLHPGAIPVKVLLCGPFSKLQLTNAMHDGVFSQELVRALRVFLRENNSRYACFDLSDATLNGSSLFACFTVHTHVLPGLRCLSADASFFCCVLQCPNLAAIHEMELHQATFVVEDRRLPHSTRHFGWHGYPRQTS